MRYNNWITKEELFLNTCFSTHNYHTKKTDEQNIAFINSCFFLRIFFYEPQKLKTLLKIYFCKQKFQEKLILL